MENLTTISSTYGQIIILPIPEEVQKLIEELYE